jgi:plastocyanin
MPADVRDTVPAAARDTVRPTVRDTVRDTARVASSVAPSAAPSRAAADSADRRVSPPAAAPSVQPAASRPAPAPAARRNASVRLKGNAFIPNRTEITAGSTVTWKNLDQMVHTVGAVDKSFTSPIIGTDGSYSHTFTRPGTYPVYCTVHPFMKATVVVK